MAVSTCSGSTLEACYFAHPAPILTKVSYHVFISKTGKESWKYNLKENRTAADCKEHCSKKRIPSKLSMVNGTRSL